VNNADRTGSPAVDIDLVIHFSGPSGLRMIRGILDEVLEALSTNRAATSAALRPKFPLWRFAPRHSRTAVKELSAAKPPSDALPFFRHNNGLLKPLLCQTSRPTASLYLAICDWLAAGLKPRCSRDGMSAGRAPRSRTFRSPGLVQCIPDAESQSGLPSARFC